MDLESASPSPHENLKPVLADKPPHEAYHAGRHSRIFLSGLYLGAIFYFFALFIEGTTQSRVNFFANIFLAIPLIGVVLTFKRIRTLKQPIFDTYLIVPSLLCVGLLSWSMGSVIWMYYNFRFHQEMPYPSWADAGYFPCLVCWTVGIVLLYKFAGVNVLNNLTIISSWVVPVCGVTVGIMIWAHSGNLSPFSPKNELFKFIFDVSYPIVDALNTALLLALILGRKFAKMDIQMRKALRYITLGYSLLFLADLSFNVLSSLPAKSGLVYHNGGPTDFMFTSALFVLSIGLSYVPLRLLAETRPN